MRSAIRVFVAALVAGTLAGCVPTVDGTSPEPPPVTAPEPAPISAGSAIELEERGPGDIFVRIDPDALEPTFYAFVTTNPDDPYYHFHTNQSDLFLSIELYTQYGPGWTGQQGTPPTAPPTAFASTSTSMVPDRSPFWGLQPADR